VRHKHDVIGLRLDTDKDYRKKVIFIASAAYSGSTMLDMMLSNRPDGFSVGEVVALFRPHRPHHFGAECGCGSPSCRIWKNVLKEGEHNVYQTLFGSFPDLRFIVDSSKHPFWIEKQSKNALRQGFDVVHVLLWKEPGAFAHSMLKRQQPHWRKHWIRYYHQYASILAKLGSRISFHSLSYETLARNPEACLEKLCGGVGISKKLNQAEFWNKQHHALFGNDSAKVHLTNRTEVGRGIRQGEITKRDSNHRSIYFDSDVQNKLPVNIAREIKSDKDIARIRLALMGLDNDPLRLSEIAWPEFRVLLSRAVYLARRLAGRGLGRWLWVY